MCYYPSRAHYVCLNCRVSHKDIRAREGRHCPRCRGELVNAGAHLAVPRKRDTAGWRALEAVLRSGLTFHGGCCGEGPGYRPRTPREVRDRLRFADRMNIPVAVALATPDPTDADRPAGTRRREITYRPGARKR
ncbi:hypothetical protein [Nocardia huaxiensis]|uniref:hypothetical protein n=1 Tax=Nocardia huaxiensis TaxID=2755382 RepID=UPI001E4C7E76|nr:hypothetical protein [Nocardia huaxiensis]UFS96347.1 hypothetical protein LPY97_37925 [Nocardia huaxiensis]